MEKLSMCRICLVENVRMYNLANLDASLLDTYEKLTAIELETKYSRPSQICYICYAHLQTCHKLRANSLHSEQLFTQMLDSDELGSTSFHNIPTVLTIHHITNFCVVPEPPHFSNTDVNIYDVDVKLEPLAIKDDVQMKLEDVEGSGDPLVFNPDAINTEIKDYKSVLNIKAEDDSMSYELKDDVQLENTKKHMEIKEDYPIKTVDNSHSDNSLNLSYNICPKAVKIVLQRVDITNVKLCDQNSLVVIKKEENRNKYDTEVTFMENKNIDTKINTALKATTEKSSDKLDDYGRMITTKNKCNAYDKCLQDDLNIHKGDLNKHAGNNCNKSYSANGNLISNIRARSSEKLCNCDTCEKCSGRKSCLTRCVIARKREKLYKCHMCAKTFTDHSLLKTHMCLHAGDKPFKCGVCQKSFTFKGNLKRHYNIHTDISFQCDICEKSFNRKSYLSNHLRIHTGEKPFKCQFCNKRYNSKSHLNSHIRIHTGERPYECDICNKHFRNKGHLKAHIRMHTGEKPYKCHFCDRCYSYLSHLNTHVRTHTGEKPYQCHVCTKSYSNKSHLNIHVRKHANEATI